MSYREVGERLGEKARGSLDELLEGGSREVEAAVGRKLEQMVGAVKRGVSEGDLKRFSAVDEERILTFMPDKRRVSGLGLVTLGLLTLVLLPGLLKLLAFPALILGALVFVGRYLSNARVDVPDGYAGVVCRYGKPTGRRAHSGRNWLYRFDTFVPFLVSQRDQVVDLEDANFTADYASITLTQQLVFRVVDPAVFIEQSSPGNIMKILSLYASYLTLRIITSVEDARVKFSGRDRIDNIIEALNGDLRATYGVEVVRGSMPGADNEILGDLEAIRTLLKEIEAMAETQQVRVEAAVKQVESLLRTRRKETRSRALDLQQTKVRLDTPRRRAGRRGAAGEPGEGAANPGGGRLGSEARVSKPSGARAEKPRFAGVGGGAGTRVQAAFSRTQRALRPAPVTRDRRSAFGQRAGTWARPRHGAQ